MEVKTISWSKKITAELAINVDSIEYKTSSLHQGEVFELPFTISVGDGLNYHGKIALAKIGWLACYVYDVKSLTGNVSMKISNGAGGCVCNVATPDKRDIYLSQLRYSLASPAHSALKLEKKC